MNDSLFRYAFRNVGNTGLSVQLASARLHHLSFIEKRLMFFCVVHLVGTPVRHLKLLLGRAQFLAAERCTALRRRLQELRVPKVRIESCPSAALELAIDLCAIPMREYERVYCMEAPPLQQYAGIIFIAQQGRLKRTEVKERHAPVKLIAPAPASAIR